jgi:hypothetical protein
VAARSPVERRIVVATKADGRFIDERARPWSRRSVRALGFYAIYGRGSYELRELALERRTPFTPACASPTSIAPRPRRGAFDDERRVVVCDGGGRARARKHARRHPDVGRFVIDERARPWSRRALRLFARWTSNGRPLFAPHRHLPLRRVRALRRFR